MTGAPQGEADHRRAEQAVQEGHSAPVQPVEPGAEHHVGSVVENGPGRLTEPSVDPLSTTRTSPVTPALRNPSRASSTHATIDDASLRQGSTTVTCSAPARRGRSARSRGTTLTPGS